MMLLTEQWVADAVAADELEFRQAVHTILLGISSAPNLPSLMVMKGGILLAIKYQSDRHTTDIDFSTTCKVADLQIDKVLAELEQGLALAVEALEYSLDCRVQSSEVRPKDPTKNFPTLGIKVGYALKGTPRHGRLLAKNASTIVSVELSFNEVITAIEVIEMADEKQIQASTIEDIVAEKFRAILQQPIRKRVRRQDVYDLFRVLQRYDLDDTGGIYRALLEKSTARGLTPGRESMRNPEVRDRSRADYDLLAEEIKSELPEFEVAFRAVQAFYENLPWD